MNTVNRLNNASQLRMKKSLFLAFVLFVSIMIFVIAPAVFAGEVSFNWKKGSILDEKNGVLEDYDSKGNIKENVGTINISDWKKYQNTRYGFEISYPSDFNYPIEKRGGVSNLWVEVFEFRKKDLKERGSFSGFDILIYDKIKSNDVFLEPKSDKFAESDECKRMKEAFFENKKNYLNEVYIGIKDECFLPDFYFFASDQKYFYFIKPIEENGKFLSKDLKKGVIENFPDFFQVSSSFGFFKVIRKNPVLAKPKVFVRMPVDYIRKEGRRVCSKKNDNPSRSNKNKKKHLDLECCLDPDEYPNPNCYYPAEKYGKYLK